MKERIKILRKSLKLSQKKFGDKIGLGQTGVAALELGRSNASGSAVEAICAAYKVNKQWLLTGIGEMFKKEDREKAVASEDSVSVLARFVTLLENMQNRLDDEKAKLWEVIEEQRDDKAVLKSILKKNKLASSLKEDVTSA